MYSPGKCRRIPLSGEYVQIVAVEPTPLDCATAFSTIVHRCSRVAVAHGTNGLVAF